MPRSLYRYQLNPALELDLVETLLIQAIESIEHLHGEPAARLEARYYLDRDLHRCVIDASSTIGVELNKLFAGALGREFAPDDFTVDRLIGEPPSLTAIGVS